MNISFSERVLRFAIWLGLSFFLCMIVDTLFYRSYSNLGTLFSTLMLLPAAFIAEFLQKYNTRKMIVINTLFAFIPIIIACFIYFFATYINDYYLGIFGTVIIYYFAPLSIITLINSIVVRIDYLYCRKKQTTQTTQ